MYTFKQTMTLIITVFLILFLLFYYPGLYVYNASGDVKTNRITGTSYFLAGDDNGGLKWYKSEE